MTLLILFKVIGASAIVCVGYIASSILLRSMREKCDALRDIISLLAMLENNFTYSENDLYTFFSKDVLSEKFLVLNFSANVTDENEFAIWKKDFSNYELLKTSLSDKEFTQFRYYWDKLGSTSAPEEISRLRYYYEQLTKRLKEVTGEYQMATKLYRSLGVSAAAIFAVLLL